MEGQHAQPQPCYLVSYNASGIAAQRQCACGYCSDYTVHTTTNLQLQAAIVTGPNSMSHDLLSEAPNDMQPTTWVEAQQAHPLYCWQRLNVPTLSVDHP